MDFPFNLFSKNFKSSFIIKFLMDFLLNKYNISKDEDPYFLEYNKPIFGDIV